MATQLFLLNTVSDTHLGTDNVNLRGTAVAWTSRALGTARGSGVVASAATATVAGATPGIEIALAGPVVCEWISPPVSADVTISGTITANLWASESANNANTAINVVIEIIRANATATRSSNTLLEIVRSTRVTELATSRGSAINFTTGMASGGYTGQTLNRGDRLRIRVFGDDAGTMGTGFTFNLGYNGATAAADGDSYVSFSETFAFESPPGLVAQTDSSNLGTIGAAGAAQQAGQPFTALGDLAEVRLWLANFGSPADNVVVEIQTDSAGSPSGSVVGTVATVSAGSLTTSKTEYTYSTSISLTPSTTYWLVMRRSGALNDTNRYSYWRSAGAVSGWTVGKFYTGTWAALAQVIAVGLMFSGTSSTLYLTDTASAVSTASVDREAWTSRGVGVQTDVRNTAAGWTAPLQLTDTAGGTVVDWFTRPLTAFTLTGMAVANLRALESNALANASLRCEVARVEGDGTSPTVWASWCVAPTSTDNGELTTSEVARTANVSGDDLAITNGQRLRIRVYGDDMSSAAMAASQTVTLYYAGTSGGASGDSYITLPQTVTEYSAGTPGPATLLSTRRLAANRYLTTR